MRGHVVNPPDYKYQIISQHIHRKRTRIINIHHINIHHVSPAHFPTEVKKFSGRGYQTLGETIITKRASLIPAKRMVQVPARAKTNSIRAILEPPDSWSGPSLSVPGPTMDSGHKASTTHTHTHSHWLTAASPNQATPQAASFTFCTAGLWECAGKLAVFQLWWVWSWRDEGGEANIHLSLWWGLSLVKQ